MLTLVTWLARLMALIGGLVLTGLVVLTCASVVGRGLNTLGHSEWMTGTLPGLGEALIASGVGPITGDFELVEAGIAFAIFAFLPVAQLYGAHATVDIFTSRMPGPAQRAIMAFWEVALAGAIILITYRLWFGMTDKMRYGETTFLLQFPIWWAYAASFAGALAASVVAVYCAFARVIGVRTGHAPLPGEVGADH